VPLVPTGLDELDAGRIQLRFLRENSDRVTALHVSLGRVRNIYLEKRR
jgi:hypothetical protein